MPTWFRPCGPPSGQKGFFLFYFFLHFESDRNPPLHVLAVGLEHS